MLLPTLALLDACACRGIAVFGIAGIIRQQLTRHIRTLPAVMKALILTTGSYGAFSVKRVSVGLDAAAASV